MSNVSPWKENLVKEGAWINAQDTTYCWITEHASWIQNPENARRLGVSRETYEDIKSIPWDFNGPGRKAILLRAMAEGFIRVRGHESYVTFESTLPTEEALRAALPFMSEHFGLFMHCQLNDLKRQLRFAASFWDIQKAIEKDTLSDLISLKTIGYVE
jgi:hypothetical protein